MRAKGPVYEFGHFRLDAAEQVLSCAGKLVRLSPKALSVLCLLVENRGHVIERDELMRTVWPDAVVEEANLSQTIFVLRKILGDTRDHHNHEFIETVARRGYRFIGAVKVHDETSDSEFIAAESDRAHERGIQDARAAWHTESTEARHLYLRGRYYWSKYTVDGLNKGIAYFHQAIKIDPDHAHALVGLADCYYRLSNIHLPPKKAMLKAKAAVTKAVKIDDSLAEAHALLGLIRTFYDRDWAAAETEFKRAIKLAPGSALTHKRYGWTMGMLGRFTESFTEMSQALDLDTRSPDLHAGLGVVLHLARRYEAAIAEAHLAIDIGPEFFPAYVVLGIAHLQQKRLTKAVAELQQAASLADVPWTLGYLGYAYGVSGKRRQALTVLADLEQRSGRVYVSPYALALIHAGLDHKEQALRLLDRTCEDRNEMLGFVKLSPELDGLRSDQRFAEMLKHSGFFAMAA